MLTYKPSYIFCLLLLLALWIVHFAQPGLAAPLGQEDHVFLPLVMGGNAAQSATPTPVTATPTTPVSTPVTPEPTTPAPTPTRPPSDRDLIAAALAQGQIDYGTSLLYRFYSLFADERLPEQFRGAGSIGEDASLFEEANDPALPAATAAQLRPFLLRPDDPESIHTVKAMRHAQAKGASATIIPCNGPWAAQSSTQPGVKVRVHAWCEGDYAGDLSKALAVIESLWTPMTGLMGAPVPDAGGVDSGSTDEIDFYLLDPLGSVWRANTVRSISSGALASSYKDKPFADGRSSGYVLLARSDLGAAAFKSTLAHEFFHVLQYAHNRAISFHGPQEWWFIEASAVWAEWYFVPETSGQEVHVRLDDFHSIDQSLHRSYNTQDDALLSQALPMYAAYLWPFFVQQEQGKPSMGRIWQELEAVGNDWEKGMQVIDNDYPFAQHFHRFALRNVNSSFGTDNPLGKRFVDLDPQFPDNVWPFATINRVLAAPAGPTTFRVEESIPALRAHYYRFRIADSVQQVTFDFTKLQPLVDRKMGALIKIKDKPWQMRELVSDLLTFCLSNPEQDLEEIWFVASHDKLDLSKAVAGPIEVRTSNVPCGCDAATWQRVNAVTAWQGHVTFHYEQNAARGDRSASIVEDGNFASTLNQTPTGVFWGKVISGSTELQYRETCCKDLVYTQSGSGEPVPFGDGPENDSGYSRMLLNFRQFDCTYSFHTNTFVNGTATTGDQSTTGVFDTGAVDGRFSLPTGGALTLSGSGIFPVHTQEFLLTFDGPFFSAIHDLELVDLLGEGNLGYATISWQFTPVDPPPAAANPSP